MDKIEVIFNMLDKWRELPSYQLERRADIFFAYYLPEIMKKELKGESITHENIIPEFPLRISGSKLSNKADYAVFCKETLYLIELKTDMDSFNDEQSEYLKMAKGKPFFELVSDIPDIGGNSNKGKKYQYLVECLRNVLATVYGVAVENKPYKYMTEYFRIQKEEFSTSALKEKFGGKDIQRKVTYILPKKPTVKQMEGKEHIDLIITFDEIVRCLEKHDKRFCESLERWIPNS